MHVPEGWRLIKLGDLLSFKNGINADAGAYGVGTKFVNLLDIFNNKYLHYKDIVGKVNATDKQREDYSVKKGDILFNRTSEIREEIAFSSVYFDEKEAVFGGFVIRGRPEKKWIDKDYSIYAFRHEYFRNQVVRMAQGAVRANIGQKDLSVVNLLLPPIAEQEKIAEILSTWDHAIEQTERLKANAETHKKALMQQLLTGKKRFPEFGGEWEEVRLGDVSLIDSGFAFKSQDFLNTSCDGNYVNVIRMSDLKSGVLDREDVARVSKEIIKGLDKYELKQNDFVFGMSGSLSNYAWVKQNDLPCYLNQRVGRIRAKEGVNSLFIHYLYLSDKTKYFIQSIAAGAAQLNISIKDLRNLKVYIPLDLGEQQKIASVLNTADREIELLTQKIEHLKSEKRALMQQLLTGKRRVKVDG